MIKLPVDVLVLWQKVIDLLAWRSDLIEPVITQIDTNIYSVGIDQSFAVMDFDNNSILLTLNLVYNFFTAQIFKGSILVITGKKGLYRNE